MTVAIPFPDVQPDGFTWLDDEPVFDPERHLALTEPESITMLTDLGYAPDEIAGKATPVACSSPFRMLSDEGADVMLDIARRLRPFAGRAGDRIERMTRGGCYRSRWLRDLCLSADVTEHLSRIYGVDIAPHAMPLHLGHINYDPSQINRSIDKWHHDTLPLDYVLMVTDPSQVPGGRFEYFTGTKHEAAEMAERGETPGPERTVVPDFPGAGWTIALHGDMVVHRAAPITELAERITMVNGYVGLDTTRDEQSRSRDLIGVDPGVALWAEWARFVAWRSAGRLESVIADMEFIDDRDAVANALEASIADVQQAIAEMRDTEKRKGQHYGG